MLINFTTLLEMIVEDDHVSFMYYIDLENETKPVSLKHMLHCSGERNETSKFENPKIETGLCHFDKM
jgi:hypothetical protein